MLILFPQRLDKLQKSEKSYRLCNTLPFMEEKIKAKIRHKLRMNGNDNNIF